MLQITIDLKMPDALVGGKRDFNCDSRVLALETQIAEGVGKRGITILF